MKRGPSRRRWGRALLLFLGGTLLWTLLVCYPNPAVFFRNLARYHRLPLDPQIEREMGWGLPKDPADIEDFLDQSLQPISDWAQYRVPWYVPTPREVAGSLQGDCESKTILFASVLAGRHIRYQIRASFNHIWVDYAGRHERPGERSSWPIWSGSDDRLRPALAGGDGLEDLLRRGEGNALGRDAALPPPDLGGRNGLAIVGCPRPSFGSLARRLPLSLAPAPEP